MTKMLVLMMLAATPFALCFTNAAASSQTCPEPANLAILSNNGGKIAFNWSDCTGGCNQYFAKYYRVGDGFQSQVFTAANSEISFSGLQAGTYDFSFATDCGDATSGWIVIQEIISN